MKMITVKFEPKNSMVEESPEKVCCEATFILFTEIKNSSQLRGSLIKGEIEAALLKPSLIYDILQLKIATNKALRSQMYNSMTTRSIYAEILYNMSPNKNISDALNKFGFSDKDKEAVAVVLSSQNDDKVASFKKSIDGKIINLDNLKNYTNEKMIKKIYKLSENEAQGDILGAILGRMACKEFPVG